MNKAQIAGQIFVYIVAVVIVGVLLIFGYQAIRDFQNRTDSITLLNFQKDMERAIDSITNQYGTVKNVEFHLTTDYHEVCFVTYDGVFYGEIEFTGYPLIYDTIEDNAEPTKNVFLVGAKNEVVESYDIGKISLSSGVFECYDVVRGKIKLEIEGKGTYVKISESGN
ncbi:hypothetical protein GOV09_02540 [Candidatus Woesearchaeota archaeon]|nr:hypothetical protein [Candidatus Woesearchaeota archaeon]